METNIIRFKGGKEMLFEAYKFNFFYAVMQDFDMQYHWDGEVLVWPYGTYTQFINFIKKNALGAC